MSKCFHCSNDQNPNEQFCHHCGVVCYRKCSVCGDRYRVGYTAICGRCGEPLLVGMEENRTLFGTDLPSDGKLEVIPSSGMSDPESALWARQQIHIATPGAFTPRVQNLNECLVRHGRVFALDAARTLHSLDGQTGVSSPGWNRVSIEGNGVRLLGVSDRYVFVANNARLHILNISTGSRSTDYTHNMNHIVNAWGWDHYLLIDRTVQGADEYFALLRPGATELPIPTSHTNGVLRDPSVLSLSEGFVILSRSGHLYLLKRETQELTSLIPEDLFDNDTVKCLTVVAGARRMVALVEVTMSGIRAAHITNTAYHILTWKREELENRPETGQLPSAPTIPWLGLLQEHILWIDKERQLHLAMATNPGKPIYTMEYATPQEIVSQPLMAHFAGQAILIQSYTQNIAVGYKRYRVTDINVTYDGDVLGAHPTKGDRVFPHFGGPFLYVCNQTRQTIVRCDLE